MVSTNHNAPCDHMTVIVDSDWLQPNSRRAMSGGISWELPSPTLLTASTLPRSTSWLAWTMMNLLARK